jgi:hypothetical protein
MSAFDNVHGVYSQIVREFARGDAKSLIKVVQGFKLYAGCSQWLLAWSERTDIRCGYSVRSHYCLDGSVELTRRHESAC